jgi:hypothetical protein
MRLSASIFYLVEALQDQEDKLTYSRRKEAHYRLKAKEDPKTSPSI